MATLDDNPSTITVHRCSGLLNALDGVGVQEGRLLFATTNRYEALDAALRRPGRMDVHIEFKLASQYQVGELFKQLYLPTPRTSTAQRPSSKDIATSNGDRKVPDFGHNTPSEAETKKLVDVELPLEVREQSLAAVARQRKRDVVITPEELEVLMERFRELVPEGEFSMAVLQGYLLMHKDQPHWAVECAGRWVEGEMAKREARKSLEKEPVKAMVSVSSFAFSCGLNLSFRVKGSVC